MSTLRVSLLRATRSHQMAARLRARGVALEGLVIDNGLANMDDLIADRNQRWPHRSIALRSVYGTVSMTGTPVVMAVTSEGRITLIEHIGDSRDPTLPSRLAEAVR